MSMIQCPNCKSMVDNSGAFCPNCGTPIAAVPEAPVQPVQAQPSQPVYVAAPVPEKRGAHGCSIAGFVCGLLGLIFCWTYIGLLGPSPASSSASSACPRRTAARVSALPV